MEVKRVASFFRVHEEKPRKQHEDFLAQQVACHNLVEHCRFSVSEVSASLKVSFSAVSLGISRFQEKFPQEKRLQKI
jgi:hypothetical protein